LLQFSEAVANFLAIDLVHIVIGPTVLDSQTVTKQFFVQMNHLKFINFIAGDI
jgi:hypothetical protein